MFDKLQSLSQKSDRRKSDEIKKKLARASEWVDKLGRVASGNLDASD